ncbi:MAG TPA: archaeal proteasome endopeptidase complex subunit beta [Candidatus Krumholzibacteriaceae bacterium]|nr:archaeal proteasome endopeptidase complex subunit beta [Candidatus Krumholzibacteriaceae bacterium]
MTDQAQYPNMYIPGATTLGLVFKDGVILASEKRVSYGYFIISKGGKKVFKITDTIGAACAGLVSDMQSLVREVEAYANLYRLDNNRPITVKATSKIMANLLFSSRFMPLITQTIVGGIDDEGASLYVLDVLGSLIPDKYASVGTGAEIAIGMLEEGYRDGMSLKEAKDLLVRAIKSAISRDAMSGNGIDLLIITKKGIEEETIPL